FDFFSEVPFGLTGYDMGAWIQLWGGLALWEQVGAEFGIKHLMCGCTGVQMGGWYRNPIRGFDDFKGLKMRLPGLGGEVLRALGGEPVLLAAADIMPALEAGTLDATEWVGPWNDEALGIQRLIKNYHYPGFHEPGTVMDLGISRTLWDSLSDAERALFEACAGSEFEVTFADFNANNGQALGRLLNDHNVVLHAFPVEVYRRLGEVARDLLATLGQDPAAAPIYQSYMDYRVYGVSWSKISEQAYMAGRELVRFHDTRGF
ncbi:MAG: TRAP transporter substrate-binding protein, partial [Candidatus Competibacterales bacterium]